MINGKGGNMMSLKEICTRGKGGKEERMVKRKEKEAECLIENMMGVCAKARGKIDDNDNEIKRKGVKRKQEEKGADEGGG